MTSGGLPTYSWGKDLRGRSGACSFRDADAPRRSINPPEVIYAGATGILPGQSLTVGVNKRLTIVHFDQESEGHVNQMLVFHADLKQRHVVLGSDEERPYSGPFNFKVRFDDIAGFQTFSRSL